MEYSPPPLFNQGPSARVRLVACVVASIILIVLDSRYSVMEVVRKVVGAGLYPIQQIATIPVTASRDAIDYVQRLGELQAENERLTKQSLIDQEKLHQLQTLRTENNKLRQLMQVAGTLRVQKTILTEVISDSNDPFSRKIIISKGSIQGIEEGMPVIDAQGLLGQVTRSYPARAEVSLITDKDQIIPVESLRNGIRSVAYGGLDGGLLELRFMAANADIENGDLLVTSGLDGVYPRGIPVARVMRVERNSRYAFASIFCEPIAGVQKHRFLLALDTIKEDLASQPSQDITPETTSNETSSRITETEKVSR
jgi:rod shape-determining protein MreC